MTTCKHIIVNHTDSDTLHPGLYLDMNGSLRFGIHNKACFEIFGFDFKETDSKAKYVRSKYESIEASFREFGFASSVFTCYWFFITVDGQPFQHVYARCESEEVVKFWYHLGWLHSDNLNFMDKMITGKPDLSLTVEAIVALPNEEKLLIRDWITFTFQEHQMSSFEEVRAKARDIFIPTYERLQEFRAKRSSLKDKFSLAMLFNRTTEYYELYLQLLYLIKIAENES